MRVLGIDPGIAIVGFGLIDKIGNRLVPVQYGCIQTVAHTPHEERLLQVYQGMTELIERYQPQAVAIEKLYFNKNVTTAFAVSQARGVILLSCVQNKIPISEYTPLQVKQGIVGYGRAEKRQIQEMVKMFLKLKEIPKPDDVADALAIAVCHAHSYSIQQAIEGTRRYD